VSVLIDGPGQRSRAGDLGDASFGRLSYVDLNQVSEGLEPLVARAPGLSVTNANDNAFSPFDRYVRAKHNSGDVPFDSRI